MSKLSIPNSPIETSGNVYSEYVLQIRAVGVAEIVSEVASPIESLWVARCLGLSNGDGNGI